MRSHSSATAIFGGIALAVLMLASFSFFHGPQTPTRQTDQLTAILAATANQALRSGSDSPVAADDSVAITGPFTYTLDPGQQVTYKYESRQVCK